VEFFNNYSELDGSDQHTILYMLIDCVSYSLNLKKLNCHGGVAKVKFEFLSYQKRSSRCQAGTFFNLDHYSTVYYMPGYKCKYLDIVTLRMIRNNGIKKEINRTGHPCVSD
jgi:hypothetical protein